LLRAHTAKVIGLEMRRTCNTDASRATGWTASMSSPYVGLPSGLCPGTRPRARAGRLVLNSGLGAAAVWCTLPVHLVDQRAIVDRREEEGSVYHRLAMVASNVLDSALGQRTMRMTFTDSVDGYSSLST
jgi:hypothetical protein